MKTNGGFVEDVENPLQVGAKLGSQADPLGFTARQGGSGAVEVQVIEAHVRKEVEALFNLRADVPNDSGVTAGKA